MRISATLLLLLSTLFSVAQTCYWQQEVDYKMDIIMNVDQHRFTGIQDALYTNNSPDTLSEIYYHLYYNAFQPGSMMDVRSRTIVDPDQRVGDRIYKLKENEIGYHKIESLTQDGDSLSFTIEGTILKVSLAKAILPGESTRLYMKFNSQVPVQIRRSGRNNIEGIDYSMAQWYPKIAEYDFEGWHAIPYVAREFHGVWGDFEVNITIDSAYTLAATGMLQNINEIGKGYGEKTVKSDEKNLTWHFKADMVHDFVWTADRDYLHTTKKVDDNLTLHFFYQNDTNIIENWEALPEYAALCFKLMNEMVGKYPYPIYSVIQGGDGGMEYPMATLILGNGKFKGLISVTVHEAVHSWFQGVLANDEGSYPWLDEGYNTYFNHLVMNALFQRKNPFPHQGSYGAYLKLLDSENFEAISLHSDHYNTNKAYGVAAYAMGCVFLNQLQYIIGSEDFDETIHRYYNTWKFKHPTPTDFKRVAEKVSGVELDWYFNYFLHTTRKIDYGIQGIDKWESDKNSTVLHLSKIGEFPMPVDLEITLKDGNKIQYNIPLRMMLKAKGEDLDKDFISVDAWPWTHPQYELVIPHRKKDIVKIEIDPTRRMADFNRSNNVFKD